MVGQLSAGMARAAGNTRATTELLQIISRCNQNIEQLDQAIAPMIPSAPTTPTAVAK